MHDDLIDRYFAAMRRGPAAEADLLALFDRDALYSEPFSGLEEPARGVEAIRARFRQGWASPPPDMELDVLEVTVNDDQATTDWECRSPAFERPVRGRDHYRFENGRIAELRVTISER